GLFFFSFEKKKKKKTHEPSRQDTIQHMNMLSGITGVGGNASGSGGGGGASGEHERKLFQSVGMNLLREENRPLSGMPAALSNLTASQSSAIALGNDLSQVMTLRAPDVMLEQSIDEERRPTNSCFVLFYFNK
ncbi:hypothetical protein RFI_33666, partial [Reticulomyxa filosa]